MTYAVTLIPGDGIGPEITEQTVRALEATGLTFSWDVQQAGMAAVSAGHDPLPDATIESIRRRKVALKGPLTTPVGAGYRSVNVALRKEFDLYANVRPAVTVFPGRYDGRRHRAGPGERRGALLRRRALHQGGRRSPRRRRVAGHRDPLRLRAGDPLRLRVRGAPWPQEGGDRPQGQHPEDGERALPRGGRAIAQEYAGRVASSDMIVDNCAMQLVLKPEQFDVIVTTNLFGDILSDEIAGLVGGLGLTAGGNIGVGAAIFEAVHGSAPDIAGKGMANPSAQMLAAAMMLDHLHEGDAARRLRQAITATIRDAGIRTRDLGGSATTREFGDAVVARLA